MSEHGGMRLAAHDIVLVERLVEGDGLREALDGVGNALLEAPAPELLLLALQAPVEVAGEVGGCGGGRFHRRRRRMAPEVGCGRREFEGEKEGVGLGR